MSYGVTFNLSAERRSWGGRRCYSCGVWLRERSERRWSFRDRSCYHEDHSYSTTLSFQSAFAVDCAVEGRSRKRSSCYPFLGCQNKLCVYACSHPQTQNWRFINIAWFLTGPAQRGYLFS